MLSNKESYKCHPNKESYECYYDVYNTAPQTISPGEILIYDVIRHYKNIILNNKHSFKILISGIYILDLRIHLDLNGVIGIYINNNLYESVYKKSGNIYIYEMLQVKKDDIINIRNCSNRVISTSEENLSLNIWKLNANDVNALTKISDKLD